MANIGDKSGHIAVGKTYIHVEHLNPYTSLNYECSRAGDQIRCATLPDTLPRRVRRFCGHNQKSITEPVADVVSICRLIVRRIPAIWVTEKPTFRRRIFFRLFQPAAAPGRRLKRLWARTLYPHTCTRVPPHCRDQSSSEAIIDRGSVLDRDKAPAVSIDFP